MHLTSKLALLAVAAITAMALVAAVPASATTAIEVVDEDTAEHCSLLSPDHTTGGCQVHAEGTITLQRWIFGWGTEDTCDIELEMRASEDSQSAIDAFELFSAESGTESGCATNPLWAMCEGPWEGSGERESETTIHAFTDVCIDPAEVDACGSTIEYDIVEGANEALSMTLVNANVGALCRLNGTLRFEHAVPGNEEIHIN